jgi:hypothetical protein
MVDADFSIHDDAVDLESGGDTKKVKRFRVFELG